MTAPEGVPIMCPSLLDHVPSGCLAGGVGGAASCLVDPAGLEDRSWRESHSQGHRRASVPGQAWPLTSEFCARKKETSTFLGHCYFGFFSFCSYT